LKGWTLVGRINELSAYSREGGAACVIDGEGSTQLYVGGRTDGEFEAIESELEAADVGLDHF
jgi:hypothetical protein